MNHPNAVFHVHKSRHSPSSPKEAIGGASGFLYDLAGVVDAPAFTWPNNAVLGRVLRTHSYGVNRFALGWPLFISENPISPPFLAVRIRSHLIDSAPSSLCAARPEDHASTFSVDFRASCEYRGHLVHKGHITTKRAAKSPSDPVLSRFSTARGIPLCIFSSACAARPDG